MRKSLKIFLSILALGIIIFLLGVKGFNLNSKINAQSEEISDYVNLSNLVADVDLDVRKSILYMPSWPEVIEEEKILFIPSTGIGTIYLCPHATSLSEVTPQCEDIEILDVGESKNEIFVETTTYNGREYYMVFGIKGTGGGEAYRTQLTYEGDLNGQYSDEVNLKATLIVKDDEVITGKTINFVLGEQTATAITDENGVATAIMELLQIPDDYTIEAKFVGEGDYLPSSDSELFEILKEGVTITVSDREGFTFDIVTLEAQVLDDDGEVLIGGPYEIEFKVNDEVIGKAQIKEDGQVEIEWNVNFIPKELIETYLIVVSFSENEYYLSAQGNGSFTLKSAKLLKQDAISELEAAKTGDKKTDKKIDKIIWLINKSLDQDLWLDASRLVFFGKGKWNFELKELDEENPEKMFDLKELGKSKGPKSGIMVFHYEKVAVGLMMPKPKLEEFEIPEWLENREELKDFKDWKISEELKSVFEKVIRKLVKADQILAKIAIFDAKNTPVQDSKFQRIVEKQIELAKKEIQKAEKELEKGRPDKAIMRLAKSWLHSQLAIKFADFKK